VSARPRSFHRIDTEPTGQRIRVSLHGELLADSADPLLLREGSLPARWYLPRQDVRVELLPSETTSVCPFKGEARYHSVRLPDGAVVEDLVWYYPEPIAPVAEIGDPVCLYRDGVGIDRERGAAAETIKSSGRFVRRTW